jgi:hypothetical protein
MPKWITKTEPTNPKEHILFAGTQSWGQVTILLYTPSGQTDPDDNLYMGFFLDQNLAHQLAKMLNEQQITPL